VPSTQRNSYDTGVINNPLVVLRKIDLDQIDEATYGIVGGAQLAFRYPEANLLWFADGYVLNDQPRMAEVSQELIDATICFAVGRTDSQTVEADNLTLQQAEAAVKGAKITLGISVDLPKDEQPKPKRKAGSEVAAAAIARANPPEIDGVPVDEAASQ
jgi:hypothetical protein